MAADGGYKSRKLWFAVYATGLLFLGAHCGSQTPAFGALYGELVGGIVGITVALFTGNVAAKLVASKASKQVIRQVEPVPPGEESP